MWNVEYVTGLSTTPGSPDELSVRLVTPLSGKCIDVYFASMDDGAAAVEHSCFPNHPNQTFFLRPVAPAAGGLLAHWKIGKTAPDSWLYDHTGRASTASVGGYGTANYQTDDVLVLNGSTGYAKTGGPVVNTSASFTVSAWVKLNALGGYQTVVAQEGAAYSAFYLQANPDGRWHMAFLNNINGGSYVLARAVSSAPVVTGSWVHLAGVYDKATGQGRLYVNGALASTTSVTGGVSASGAVWIGSAWSGSARVDSVNGQIDDIRVWEVALPATTISQLYSAGAE